MHDREAAHGAGAEPEQRQAGDQRRDVGVQDGGPRALVAGGDRRLRRAAGAQFLADALVDQHVGVDGHAQRQRDGGDARQGQRRLDQRQHRHQQQQVDRQRQRGDHAEQQVVAAHEHEDGDEAPGDAVQALGDVVGAQARADGRFLDEFHRGGERAGAQQQREVVGLGDAGHALDLEALTELALDHGRGDDLALALLEQHDGHALADVVAGHVVDDAGALGVHRQRHDGPVALLVRGRLRIGQVVTADDHVALDDDAGAIAVREAQVAERHQARAIGGGVRLGAVVDHVDLERRRAADQLARLGRVLDAGQFDHDAVGALLLDHRLGGAQAGDPVAQRGHVLLDRLVLRLHQRGRLHRADDLHVGAVRRRRPLHIGEAVGQRVEPLRGRRGLVEDHRHGVAVARDRRVQRLLAQQRAGVGIERRGLLVERRLQVDLEQEVHAAAQVQAQVHRQGVQRGHPARRARHQVQRDRVGRGVRIDAVVQAGGQHVARVDLRVGGVEARVDRRALEGHVVGLDGRRLQQLLDLRDRVGPDLGGQLGRGHLHRRRLAVQVRHRVQQADQHGDDHQQVFPDRVAIHTCFLGRRRRSSRRRCRAWGRGATASAAAPAGACVPTALLTSSCPWAGSGRSRCAGSAARRCRRSRRGRTTRPAWRCGR